MTHNDEPEQTNREACSTVTTLGQRGQGKAQEELESQNGALGRVEPSSRVRPQLAGGSGVTPTSSSSHPSTHLHTGPPICWTQSEGQGQRSPSNTPKVDSDHGPRAPSRAENSRGGANQCRQQERASVGRFCWSRDLGREGEPWSKALQAEVPEHPPRPKAALRDSKKAREAGERQVGKDSVFHSK